MRLALISLFAALTIPVHAQRTSDIPRASGGGELSLAVVATWEAHGQPQAGGDPRSAPMTLDLLVLWRGSPGWLKTQPSQGAGNQLFAGPGYPERTHQVSVRGRMLELRVDSRANTATVDGRQISLNGVNVVMIDRVDSGQPRIAGVTWIDPSLSAAPDIIELLQRSPLLQEFVKG